MQPTLPNNPTAERATLGAILLRHEALTMARAELTAADFYQPAHRVIFAAMCAADDAGMPVEVATIAALLERAGEMRKLDGGAGYLVALLDEVVTATSIEHYANLVAESSTLRKVVDFAMDLRGKILTGEADLGELIGKAQTDLLALARRGCKSKAESLGAVMVRTIEGLVQARNGGIVGIPTGFADVDEHLGGMREEELYYLAARPRIGKTALAVSIARNVAVRQTPVLVFSLEMGARQLCERMLAADSRIELSNLRRGCVDDPEKWREVIRRAPEVAAKTRMWFSTLTSPTIAEVRADAIRWAVQEARGKQGLIVLDYVQLVRGGTPRDSRQQQIGEVSRGLKALAKDLHMPVLALAQVSRDVDKRGGDARPQLADLREAGDLENDADAVIMLYRDEVYDDKTDEPGIAELIFRKNRNGREGTVKLRFVPEHTAFYSLERRRTANGHMDDYGTRVSP